MWCTLKLLDGLNCKSKAKNNERKRSWGTPPGSQHFKGRGVCWSSGMGLRRLIRKSLTHTNLHKPNNNLLVNAYLEHLWCTDEPRANTDSQNSPWPELGRSHHLPFYSILYAWPWDQHPNIILSRNSQVESRNSQSWDSCNFGSP
jgi:hypothetical protein